MRKFDYISSTQKLLTPEILKLITKIHEHKGKQDLLVSTKKDELTGLLNVAKIQSTGASNRIEGIHTTDKRLKELVENKVNPKNRSELEIIGYRDVLTTIHESYKDIPLEPNVILQLHRDLYSYESTNSAGKYKISDNVIIEKDSLGNQQIRFQPMSAYETPSAINTMCAEYNTTQLNSLHDNLIIIPMIILDFLCIHPFNDGNGRMSRLLTLLLLYKSGYIVGKYISIETLIENSKDAYYESLQKSSTDWINGKNDYLPFVTYFLKILIKAYSDFENRVKHLGSYEISKTHRVKIAIDESIGKVTKKEIMIMNPDISKITVERALAKLVKDGYVQKVGAGPSTAYVKAKISNH